LSEILKKKIQKKILSRNAAIMILFFSEFSESLRRVDQISTNSTPWFFIEIKGRKKSLRIPLAS